MKRYPIPTFDYCLDSQMKSLHGCVLYSNKHPVAQAKNELCGCVIGKQVKKYIPSIHAEMNVLHRARYVLKKINNPVLVVVRYNRNGDLVNSYPCNLCIDIIRKSGIIKVIYSDDNGNMCECRTKNLEYRFITRATKRLCY